MKSIVLAFLLLLLLLLPHIILGQKIGMHTTTPLHPVHLKQPTGTTLTDQQPVLFSEYTGTNAQHVIGIQGKSKPQDNFGYGGDFEGGLLGVQGRVTGSGEGNYYGVTGLASGTGEGHFHGLFGYASGAGTNIGVAGTATGGTTNWAGYFGQGNVHVQNKLAVGTLNPQWPMHVTQGYAALGDNQPIAKIEYVGGGNPNEVIGLEVQCSPSDGNGVGGKFQASRVGLNVSALSTNTSNSCYGVFSFAQGSTTANYGVYGTAGEGPGINCGVYGTSYYGDNDYSGYFDNSKVYIDDKLGIGEPNPFYALDAKKIVCIARFISTGYTFGGQIILKNETASPTDMGSILFDTNGTYPGGIYYHANNVMALRVNHADRLIINASGLMGVGRTPTTNRLEVEGNASKSSAGDWVANSDARLKKNIQALDSKTMIEKLLALKGITYEWNDDKTGTSRPEGVQYGFTAQNIQAVFPELVEEDANGFLQTAYSTYDAMIIEAIRYLYEENKALRAMLEN